MTVQSDIQTAMRAVISAIGETGWTYRTLTSALDAEAKTWSATSTMTAQLVSESLTEVHDPNRGGFLRHYTGVVKVSDAVSLKQGDQVIDANGTHWAVDGDADATNIDGIKRYQIGRDVVLTGADEKRGRT